MAIIVINPPRSVWKPLFGYAMVGGGGVSIFQHVQKKKEGVPVGGILSTALGVFLATRP
jgi:hypothetical protein